MNYIPHNSPDNRFVYIFTNCNDIIIDKQLNEIIINGKLVHLKKSLLNLLYYFIENKNTTISHNKLLLILTKPKFQKPNSNIPTVRVCELNKLMGNGFIRNNQNKGYILYAKK
jgi:DNA-binding winged helix-turn-helix (wHTH) protein